MEKEIWKPIPDYVGHYKISNYGRLKSYDKIVRGKANSLRTLKGRLRKLSLAHPVPYLQATLSKDGVLRTHRIHRLVAITFLTDWAPNLEVNHIDGDKLNNRVDNLEMCTKKENINHARKTGLINDYGENHVHARLTNEEANQIRQLYYWWEFSQCQLAECFDVCQQTISEILTNKTYIR